LMDALHTFWLHTLHSGPQFPSVAYGANPDDLRYEETQTGMRFVLARKLGNGKWWELIWEMIMPLNVHLVYTDEPKSERVRAVTYCVPVDDTHQLGASVRWLADDETESLSGREQLAPGTALRAEIDWERRLRHMRFHTATHLLCAVVRQLVDGCSITSDYARLDFAMTDLLDKADVQAGLDRLIAEAHPVTIESISDEELLANPQLVKSMSVSPPIGFGRVRLLRVQDVDLQPCGGTHVRNTAEIGNVRVAKIEKKSARTRRVVLEFGL